MPDQPTLDLAYADRRAGQDANLAAGSAGHKDHRAIVEDALALLLRNRAKAFTADDVHKLVSHVLPDGYDRNLVSSVMGIAAAEGRIIRDHHAGLVPSRNRSRKGSRNAWWRACPVRES